MALKIFETKKVLSRKEGEKIILSGCLRVALPIAEWTGNSADYRCEYKYFRLSPAYLDDEKCWLLSQEWTPSDPPAIEEDIIEFGKGIKLLVSSGAFAKLFW